MSGLISVACTFTSRRAELPYVRRGYSLDDMHSHSISWSVSLGLFNYFCLLTIHVKRSIMHTLTAITKASNVASCTH